MSHNFEKSRDAVVRERRLQTNEIAMGDLASGNTHRAIGQQPFVPPIDP